MMQPSVAILSDRQSPWIRELLSRCRAHVDLFSSAWQLRKALLDDPRPVRRVLVGAVDLPSPINVAAALVRDGCALSVTLVVDGLSGSVRSRAFQAGITAVMTPDEVVAAFANPGENAGPIAPEPRRPPVPTSSEELDLVPAEAGQPDAMAPKIVLVSGRGGVGKTAICALMAATAASWGLDVALVDLDLGFGNLFGYFGLDGPADLTRLGRTEGLAELGLCGKRAAERVTLFGPCAKPEYAETVAPKISEMLDALALAHDLVLVDGGTSWGDGVAQSVQAADRLLVCSDERSGAIGSLARVGSLAVRLGVARTRICQLVNRCDPKHRDEGFLTRAAEGFPSALTIHIEEGDVEVAEVMSVGRVVDLVNVSNPFSESVARNLGILLSELGILPEHERALKAVGSRRSAARRDARPGEPMDGRWAA